MTTQINGLEYEPNETIAEFIERLKQKGEFEQTAKGFKTNITKAEQTAQNLIDGMGVNSPSFFSSTRPLKELSYFRYVFGRGRG